MKFKYPMILGPSVVFEFPQLLYSAYLMISGNTTTAAAFLKYIASPKAVFLADVTEMIIGNPVSTIMTTFPAYLFLIWAKITVLNCCSFNSFHSAGVSAFGITLCLYLKDKAVEQTFVVDSSRLLSFVVGYVVGFYYLIDSFKTTAVDNEYDLFIEVEAVIVIVTSHSQKTIIQISIS